MTASKDKAGLHISDSGSGELDVVGTTGTSGDAGGGPKGNRLKEAELEESWPTCQFCVSQTPSRSPNLTTDTYVVSQQPQGHPLPVFLTVEGLNSFYIILRETKAGQVCGGLVDWVHQGFSVG